MKKICCASGKMSFLNRHTLYGFAHFRLNDSLYNGSIWTPLILMLSVSAFESRDIL